MQRAQAQEDAPQHTGDLRQDQVQEQEDSLQRTRDTLQHSNVDFGDAALMIKSWRSGCEAMGNMLTVLKR